jgi:hypothetical protein
MRNRYKHNNHKYNKFHMPKKYQCPICQNYEATIDPQFFGFYCAHCKKTGNIDNLFVDKKDDIPCLAI